jgi:putative SbcD/Mre11-related phosphoesterase
VHLEERTAVIADVHLGYEWARGGGGDSLPAHSLRETLKKLESLFANLRLDRLIVAGDMVESAAPFKRTASDLRRLSEWLNARHVELVVLQGNHDPPRRPALSQTIEVAGWTIGHGHHPIPGVRVVLGHHHPVLKAAGLAAPCFLYGPSAIVLPAFSPNAAGLDVRSTRLSRWVKGRPLRCAAALDGAIFDFGPLEGLGSRLQRALNRR